MATPGNLPASESTNSTTDYFNNFFSQEFAVSPNVNDAITGYFQYITGDKETGKVLATSVIYTALSRGIDPMSLIDEFKKYSDQNKLNAVSVPHGNTNANVHVAIVPGTAYTDSFTIISNTTPQTTQTTTVNLLGTKDRAVVTGYELSGFLTSTDTVSGQVSLINANLQDDSFTEQTNVAANYGTFNVASNGQWDYQVTVSSLPNLEPYTDTIELTRSANDKLTQSITVTIDNTGGELAINKVKVNLLDDVLPAQIVGNIDLANILAQTSTIGTNKFGKFTIDITGLWYYILNPFPIIDPLAIKGPNARENNLNELDAYLTVLLNTNRVNTSLLGIGNQPEVNKYIARAILP